MTVPKMMRAWAWSVLVCTVIVALLASLIQAGQVGGTLGGVFDMTVYFSLTFAAVALVICLPVFLLLERVSHVLDHRGIAVSVGALLAALSSVLLVVWFFRGPGDPQTLSGWVSFWLQNAVPFAAGIAPFAIGGATFGARWTAPDHAPIDPPPARKGRRGRRLNVRTPGSTSPRVP